MALGFGWAPQKHAHTTHLAKVLGKPYIFTGMLVKHELNPASHLYRKVGSSVVHSLL
jgi:adenylate kinase